MPDGVRSRIGAKTSSATNFSHAFGNHCVGKQIGTMAAIARNSHATGAVLAQNMCHGFRAGLDFATLNAPDDIGNA
jgi:hypothetical protein